MDTILYKRHPNHKHLFCGSNGEVYSLKNNYFLSLKRADNGYYRTTINGKRDYIHRVISTAFLGEIKHGYNVNHKNGVKTDNRVSNLEIVTYKENINHGFNMGLIESLYGEESPRSKITESVALQIIQQLKAGLPQSTIANKLKISRNIVRWIKENKSWKHLKR